MNSESLPYSKHANIQLQRRAIPPLVVDLLRDYGFQIRRGESYTASFDKRALKKAKKYLGTTGSSYLDKYSGSYAIFAADTDAVITVGWKNMRFTKDRYRSSSNKC